MRILGKSLLQTGVPAPLPGVGLGGSAGPRKGRERVPFSLRRVAVAEEGCGLDRKVGLSARGRA